jgi:hypothetical protein
MIAKVAELEKQEREAMQVLLSLRVDFPVYVNDSDSSVF